MSSVLTLLVIVCVSSVALGATSPFWPQPAMFSLGSAELMLSQEFAFEQIPVDAMDAKSSELLQRGLERYHRIYNKYRKDAPAAESEDPKVTISQCGVKVLTILDPKEEKASLDIDVDESYKLNIQQDAGQGGWKCDIEAPTVWGALHALETFTQLLSRFGDNYNFLGLNYGPVSVEDKPRFTHRGLLIDSARHFLPVDTVKMMIDSLTLVHMNVLHWHFEDAQSFPMDTPSAPEMVKGAFSPKQVYTMDQVKDINNYAAERGVRIVYELDGPGHAASWAPGYPELVPDKCIEKYSYNVNDFAANPTLDKTYEVVRGILTDIVNATDTKFLHLGGDEVVYGCWAIDDQINDYMQANNIATYPDLLALYVHKVEDIAHDLNTVPIQWEDTFIAGVRPDLTTIFDVWTNSSQIAAVTAAGYRVIAGPSDFWYLDHLNVKWTDRYTYEPEADIPAEQRSLIIGGEASMFGETVDEFNIQGRVWPQAAAVAERLWSPKSQDAQADIPDATLRLHQWVCRQNFRGFYSGPIAPGFCAEKLV